MNGKITRERWVLNPKAKTKDIPFGNTAVQVEQGVWEFETGGFKWRYLDLTNQINLQIWTKDHWVGVVYVRDHREAGCFAEGFAQGYDTASSNVINKLKEGTETK